jgi:hypothetical protein
MPNDLLSIYSSREQNYLTPTLTLETMPVAEPVDKGKANPHTSDADGTAAAAQGFPTHGDASSRVNRS